MNISNHFNQKLT